MEKLKNEWEIVHGQLSSGNDSPVLKKRAKELIQLFIDKKLISKSEGVNLLMKL